MESWLVPLSVIEVLGIKLKVKGHKMKYFGAHAPSHHPYNQVSVMCPQRCLLLMIQSDEMR